MSETLADLRLLDAHMRATYDRKSRVSGLVLRAARTFGFGSPDFLEVAVDAVLAGQTEQALATWELHETASELADPLGRRLDVDPPLDVMVGAAAHDGTPLETVYRRPGSLLAELAVEGVVAEIAQARAERMAVELVDVDLAVAGRNAEAVHAVADLRVVGYRRVPNGGACDWCRYIATQRYTVGNLAPAHAHCGCGTREIYGKRDPGPVLNRRELERIKRDGVPKRAGSRKASARRANRKIDVGAPLPTVPKLDAVPDVPKIADPTPKIRPDYSTAKNRDEVVRLFEDAHPGVRFEAANWDTKTARFAAETFEDLDARFPLSDETAIRVFGELKSVYPERRKWKRGVGGMARANVYDFDPETGAFSVTRNGGNLGVGTKTIKTDADAALAKREGWWSTGRQEAVIVHEYGHHVGYEAELALLRRNVDEVARRRRAVAPGVPIKWNAVGGELWQEELAKMISREFGDGGPASFGEFVPTLRRELSEYGASNGREAMAEAFAEVALEGDGARPMAKKIVELALALVEEGKSYK